MIPIASIAQGTSGQAQVPLTSNPARLAPGQISDSLQVAIKTMELNIAYYTDTIPIEALFTENGNIETDSFLESWRALGGMNEATENLLAMISSIDQLTQTFLKHNIFVMAHRKVKSIFVFL